MTLIDNAQYKKMMENVDALQSSPELAELMSLAKPVRWYSRAAHTALVMLQDHQPFFHQLVAMPSLYQASDLAVAYATFAGGVGDLTRMRHIVSAPLPVTFKDSLGLVSRTFKGRSARITQKAWKDLADNISLMYARGESTETQVAIATILTAMRKWARRLPSAARSPSRSMRSTSWCLTTRPSTSAPRRMRCGGCASMRSSSAGTSTQASLRTPCPCCAPRA